MAEQYESGLAGIGRQPILAAIMLEGSSSAHTLVHVHVFRQRIALLWQGNGHQATAAAWCKKFNLSVGDDWRAVREAPAGMMEKFCQALQAEGVPQATITRAAQGAVHYG